MEQETDDLKRSGSLSSLFENLDKSSCSYESDSQSSDSSDEIEDDDEFLIKKEFTNKCPLFEENGFIE